MNRIEEIMYTESSDGKQHSLGIDDHGNLYINGNRVVTEQRFKLAWWINVAVFLGGIGAFAQCIVAILEFFKITIKG